MSPILTPDVFEFTSGSPAQTRRIGERLGERLQPGDVIALEGPLGAGKTCLSQGIGAGWGAEAGVTSPTFTLIHEMRRAADRIVLYHIDLFRIESIDAARRLGLSDVFDGRAVCVIEWPERAPGLVPDERLHVQLSMVDETRRRMTLRACGVRPVRLLSDLKRAAFGVNE